MYTLQNLTEFNTAHNKRISTLTIEEGNLDIQRPKRKRRSSRVIFSDEEEIINPGTASVIVPWGHRGHLSIALRIMCNLQVHLGYLWNHEHSPCSTALLVDITHSTFVQDYMVFLTQLKAGCGRETGFTLAHPRYLEVA